MRLLGVVLAGGKGTRLWPISRADLPKQFASLGAAGDPTLFECTVARLSTLPATLPSQGTATVQHQRPTSAESQLNASAESPHTNSSDRTPENGDRIGLLILASHDHEQHIARSLSGLSALRGLPGLTTLPAVASSPAKANPKESPANAPGAAKSFGSTIGLMLEPQGRSTAAAATVAAHYALARYGAEVVIAICPSDHAFADESTFRTSLLRAAQIAAVSDRIVTLGVEPTRPETGFGYIRRGAPLSNPGQAIEAENHQPGKEQVYEIGAFREKPDEATATEMIGDGQHYWNAGIFVFRPATLLAHVARLQPTIGEASHQALAEARRRPLANPSIARTTPASITQEVRSASAPLRPEQKGPSSLAAVAPQESPATDEKDGIEVSELEPKSWARVPSVALDVAIMEKLPASAGAMVVLPKAAGWDDLGTWLLLDHRRTNKCGHHDASANPSTGDFKAVDPSAMGPAGSDLTNRDPKMDDNGRGQRSASIRDVRDPKVETAVRRGENVAVGDVIIAGKSPRNNLILAAPGAPLVAMAGMSDAVVVATGDAVLVSDRAHVQDVRDVVSQLEIDSRPELYSRQATKIMRPWGWYETIVAGPRFQVKRLHVEPRRRLSLQFHHRRSEHWVVVRGTARALCVPNPSQLQSTSQSTSQTPKSTSQTPKSTSQTLQSTSQPAPSTSQTLQSTSRTPRSSSQTPPSTSQTLTSSKQHASAASAKRPTGTTSFARAPTAAFAREPTARLSARVRAGARAKDSTAKAAADAATANRSARSSAASKSGAARVGDVKSRAPALRGSTIDVKSSAPPKPCVSSNRAMMSADAPAVAAIGCLHCGAPIGAGVTECLRILKEGDSIDIPVGAAHRLENPGTSVLEVVEVQIGDYVGEDDIVRLDDDFGRSDRFPRGGSDVNPDEPLLRWLPVTMQLISRAEAQFQRHLNGEAEAPNTDAQAPNTGAKAPHASAPNTEAKAPHADAKAPNADAKAQSNGKLDSNDKANSGPTNAGNLKSDAIASDNRAVVVEGHWLSRLAPTSVGAKGRQRSNDGKRRADKTRAEDGKHINDHKQQKPLTVKKTTGVPRAANRAVAPVNARASGPKPNPPSSP